MGKVFDVIKGEEKRTLDINDHMVKHPASTFFMEMEGEGPEGSDIKAGDVLVVDRALTPKKKDLIVAEVEGELVLTFYTGSEQETVLWGKVTGFLRHF